MPATECFATELAECTASNAIIYTGLDCANIPFVHDRLPELVARRSDITPLAKRVYADRLNHLFQVCWPNHQREQHTRGAVPFVPPFTAFSTLVDRLGASRRSIIRAIHELEQAGLFRVKRSRNPDNRCNRFTPLSCVLKDDHGLIDEHNLEHLPVNGKQVTPAQFAKLRYLPIPSSRAAVSTCMPSNQQTRSADLLVYALIARFAKPVCYMPFKDMSIALGMDRRTITRSIKGLFAQRLIGGSTSGNRVYFFLVAHPALANNEAETVKLRSMLTSTIAAPLLAAV